MIHAIVTEFLLLFVLAFTCRPRPSPCLIIFCLPNTWSQRVSFLKLHSSRVHFIHIFPSRHWLSYICQHRQWNFFAWEDFFTDVWPKFSVVTHRLHPVSRNCSEYVLGYFLLQYFFLTSPTCSGFSCRQSPSDLWVETMVWHLAA